MLADLYHHIAQSYNNAPDLRVTWLKSLASLHEKNKCVVVIYIYNHLILSSLLTRTTLPGPGPKQALPWYTLRR